MRITLSERAKQEYLEGFRYLLEENPNAAIRFESEIDRSVELIADNPEIGRPTESLTIRSLSLRSFRYRIFYVIDGEEMIVLSIFHTSRNPRNIPHG